VHVPDSGVLFRGDLVEQAGPPVYGSDSFPLDWPLTLTRLLELRPDVIVPGHGDPVDHAFARAQRDAIASVAHGIREAYDSGYDPIKALTALTWAYDPIVLMHALTRGFVHLKG